MKYLPNNKLRKLMLTEVKVGKRVLSEKRKRLYWYLIQGESFRQAMIKAGYAQSYVDRATRAGVLKSREANAVARQLDLRSLNPEYIKDKIYKVIENTANMPKSAKDHISALKLASNILGMLKDSGVLTLNQSMPVQFVIKAPEPKTCPHCGKPFAS